MPEEPVAEKLKEGLSNVVELATKAPMIPLMVADVFVDNVVCGAAEIAATVIKQSGETSKVVTAKVSEIIEKVVRDVRELIEFED